MFARVMMVLVLSTPTALAEPRAFAINEPLGWYDARSIGVSYYDSVTTHHVIRASIASYANRFFNLDGLASDDAPNTYRGRTTDLGLGWMYFPRRAHDGLSLELCALVRMRDLTTIQGDSASPLPYRVDTNTRTLAARALVGWSWLYEQRAFFSIAAGVSVGRQWGTETTQYDTEPMTVTTPAPRLDVAFESCVRAGVVFNR